MCARACVPVRRACVPVRRAAAVAAACFIRHG